MGAMGLLWQAIGKLFLLEVSTLSFIADISDFTKALEIQIMPDNLKRSIVIVALESSFSIYCNKNNYSAMDASYNLVYPVFVL